MAKSKKVMEEIQSLPDFTPDDQRLEQAERKLLGYRGEIAYLKRDNERLVKKNQELSDAIDQIASIGQQPEIQCKPIALPREDKHTAIAVIQWGDWHVAEKVERRKTNGLNEYNPETCEARVKALTKNTLKLIDLYRKHVTIDDIVLVLGGDFITGFIHEELAQTNCMGVSEESYFALKLLNEAVGSLLASAKAKVRVVCHRGNHGRYTRKIQFKNDHETSWESFIYWCLRDRLSGDGVVWTIPHSDIAYTELVPGKFLRTMHGHQVKYQGGIGGISVPLTRWIIKQDQTHKAVTTMLGHFHTKNTSTLFSIAASLKGHDEFALSLGFPYEPPSQTFHLFDCKRQLFTTTNPIFCE